MQRGFAPILILVGILVIIGIAGGTFFLGAGKSFPVPIKNSPKACIQDAKQCADGSYVGREGPNCEFKECPASKPSSTPDETTNSNLIGANWKEYRTAYYVLNYPSNWNTGIPNMDASEQNLDQIFFGNNSELYILGISVYGQQNWESRKNLLGLTISSKDGTQEIDFRGIKGFKRQGYFGENGNDYGFIMLINSNGKVYEISAYQRTNKGDYTKYVDQILSTFKFTN